MTVSSCSWQHGHIGESALAMRWRCLLRGAWPVIIWVIILVCFRGRLAMLLKKFACGRPGTIALVRL